MNDLQVMLIGRPTDEDWINVKRRALITIYGDHEYFVPPSSDWKHRILAARHSPIRYLRYSFLCKWIPSNIAVHFCRHVHAQPYCSSLRNDRQHKMDGDAARRDTPINMILDVNAEELMVMANKRLCMNAAEKTREIMQEMCRLAQEATPELEGLLVPMCEWCGGVCHEMYPCGRRNEGAEDDEH